VSPWLSLSIVGTCFAGLSLGCLQLIKAGYKLRR
jgi:hypothetical protein